MGTLVCRVELSKLQGIILTVENADADICQTIVMNGTSITTTVEGPDETSVMTQDQESIAIQCKRFEIDAKTITCKSSGKTEFSSGEDFSLDSQANVNVKAAMDADYEAMNATFKGQMNTEVKGTNVKLVGDAGAELSSPMTKVEATGKLDVTAGGIANIKGSVVNIGGLVKMG